MQADQVKNTDQIEKSAKLIASQIIWIVEIERYLNILIQDFNTDFSYEDKTLHIDTTDENTMVNIIQEYLNKYLNTDDVESLSCGTVVDEFQKNIRNYCQVLSKNIMIMKGVSMNRTQNVSESNISFNAVLNQRIKDLESENKSLKDNLEMAKVLIIQNHIPDNVIEALNKTQEISKREIADLDQQYVMKEEQLKESIEKLITKHDEEMKIKENIIDSKDKEILELKNKLNYSEFMINQLKKSNEDLCREADEINNNSIIENQVMKKKLNRIQEVCESNFLRAQAENRADVSTCCHVVMENKLVGETLKMEDKSCMTSYVSADIGHLECRGCISKTKDHQDAVAFFENTMRDQEEIISSMQNTLDWYNITCKRFQKMLSAKKAEGKLNASKTKYYTAQSTKYKEIPQRNTFVTKSGIKNSSQQITPGNSMKKVIFSEEVENFKSSLINTRNLANGIKKTNVDSTLGSIFHDSNSKKKFVSSTPLCKKSQRDYYSLDSHVESHMSVEPMDTDSSALSS